MEISRLPPFLDKRQTYRAVFLFGLLFDSKDQVSRFRPSWTPRGIERNQAPRGGSRTKCGFSVGFLIERMSKDLSQLLMQGSYNRNPILR